MYRTLDLFAGAGGLSLGFEMTGQFNTIAIVENNANAAKTFINNHKGVENYQDILRVDFQELKEKIGDVDIVIGGPPCQGFSNANRQRRQLVNGSNELVKKYVEAISVLKPKAFVMENVKTIASETHYFCVTNEDKKYLENDLGICPENKKVKLYEGDRVINIKDSMIKYPVEILSMLSEEELYFLYNVVKKWDKLVKYFAKETNKKKLKEIVKKLLDNNDVPVWLRDDAKTVVASLEVVLKNTTSATEKDKKTIKEFWDIQRYYQGILELKNKKICYQVRCKRKTITVVLKTYVVIDYIRRAFANLGYVTKENQLNAAMFGVPQTRERFIMIGVLPEYKVVDQISEIQPLITSNSDYITVRTAIGDLKSMEPTVHSMDVVQTRTYLPKINSFYRSIVINPSSKKIYNHVCTESRQDALDRFKVIAPGENFHSLPDDLKKNYENPKRTQNTVYRRLSYELPSDTVVNVRKSMWIHPELDRAISAREAARLQSFPDDYVFYGTKDSVYQQIGNAVPPLLGRAVAEKVLEILGQRNEGVESLKEIYARYL